VLRRLRKQPWRNSAFDWKRCTHANQLQEWPSVLGAAGLSLSLASGASAARFLSVFDRFPDRKDHVMQFRVAFRGSSTQVHGEKLIAHGVRARRIASPHTSAR
jgi:hypothetical protein